MDCPSSQYFLLLKTIWHSTFIYSCFRKVSQGILGSRSDPGQSCLGPGVLVPQGPLLLLRVSVVLAIQSGLTTFGMCANYFELFSVSPPLSPPSSPPPLSPFSFPTPSQMVLRCSGPTLGSLLRDHSWWVQGTIRDAGDQA